MYRGGWSHIYISRINEHQSHGILGHLNKISNHLAFTRRKSSHRLEVNACNTVPKTLHCLHQWHFQQQLTTILIHTSANKSSQQTTPKHQRSTINILDTWILSAQLCFTLLVETTPTRFGAKPFSHYSIYWGLPPGINGRPFHYGCLFLSLP